MLDLAQISVTLNQIYAPQIADQLNQKTDTFAKMPKTIGEGKNIAWDVKVSRNPRGGSYASGAELNTFNGDEYDVEQPAVLPWKRYFVPFQVSGDALAVAARSGPEAYAKLFDKQMRDAQRNLSVILGTQVFGDGTGNTNLDMDGILAAIGSTTGSYAGLNRGTYPVWQSNVFKNGGVLRNLSTTLLQSGERAVFTATGMTPDVIVTTPDLYSKYESLFNENAPDGSIIRISGDTGTYRQGATQLYYKNMPVMRDARCPANSLFMLTWDAWEFEMLPSLPEAEGVKLEEAQTTMENADGSLGVQVAIELLGKTGDSVKGYVKVYGNLKCENPNWNAYVGDLQ